MRDFVAVVQRMSQEDLSAWSSTAGSKMVGTRVRTKPENLHAFRSSWLWVRFKNMSVANH